MTILTFRSAAEPETLSGYRVADLALRSSLPAPELEPFSISSSSVLPTPTDSDSRPTEPHWRRDGRLLFRGVVDVGGGRREIEAHAKADGFLIGVSDVADFFVERRERSEESEQDRGGIWYRPRISTRGEPTRDGLPAASSASSTGSTRSSEHATVATLAAVAYGPPLMLALALHRRWVLHASAVRTPHGVLVFLGASGTGKSMLARTLDRSGWPRVADDLVALRAAVDAPIELLPRFPQPALAPQLQPVAFPEQLPIAAICLLEPREERAKLVPLAHADAALALVRHTAAAKLFDRDLLEWQLSAAARTAASLPVWRLGVPWNAGGPAQVGELLARHIAALYIPKPQAIESPP